MKKNLLVVLAFACTLASCSHSKNATKDRTAILGTTSGPQPTNGTPFELTETSTDKDYGYTDKKPIKVGGEKTFSGPVNERRFLNALAGPNGEAITYVRLGSCCPFNTPNSSFGGLLDKYEIKWEGQAKPAILFINMYDDGDMKIPVGFTLKK